MTPPMTPTPPKPPKREAFDVASGVNVDPKGFIREVDVYRAEPWGLYMARGADHPDFGYLESWLLPSAGLRVSVFHRRVGGSYDFERYIDVADVTPAADAADPWTTVDLYLDVVVAGGVARVEDADELADAIAAGILSAADGASAIDRAWRAVRGITAHDGDVDAWLASEGMPVTWADPGGIDHVPEGAWPAPRRA